MFLRLLLIIFLVFSSSVSYADLNINIAGGTGVKFGQEVVGCGEPFMFIGDSITANYNVREYFFTALPDCTYDAVGDQTGPDTNYQDEHAAVGGDFTADIIARVTPALVEKHFNDFTDNGKVYIHMGTNGTSLYTTNVTNLETLLDIFDARSLARDKNPITVYVCRIIPNTGSYTSVTTLNNTHYTPALDSYSASSIKIVEVDMYQSFLDDTYGRCSGDWEANCMADSLHPNSSGAQTMADQLQDCIDNPDATNCRSVNF